MIAPTTSLSTSWRVKVTGTLLLQYSPNHGRAFRDGEVLAFADRLADELSQGHRHTVVFATQNILFAVRRHVARGTIPHDAVTILFKNKAAGGFQTIKAYPGGGLDPWPKGFCDLEDDIMRELIALDRPANAPSS
jgi:hypothetical protein